MSYYEVIKIIEFDPISPSADPGCDYYFRVEVLKRPFPGKFQLRVFRHEAFRYKLANVNEEREIENIILTFDDVSLYWEKIATDSPEEAISKIIDEILWTFTFPDAKGVDVPRYVEIVKIIDLEPIRIEELDETYWFRLEIIKKSPLEESYGVRAYYYDSFELQPAFPIVDGQPFYERAAPRILVRDESSVINKIEGGSVPEVIQHILNVADELKNTPLKH